MHADDSWAPRSRLIAAGRPVAPGDPLNVPIVGVTTYALGGDRIYSRSDGTPTWDALESVVGSVEGGPAVAFASGMAAISAALTTVPTGARIAAPVGCYHGTTELLRSGERDGRWRVTWLAATQTAAWCEAATEHDLLWLESPTNPLLEVMDLPRILAAASAGCRTVVDSTLATPLGQSPLRLGADMVVHSATKHLGGHSDALGGVAVAREPSGAEGLRRARALHGSTPGMLEAWLITRGLRSLAVRFEAASTTAVDLAERLDRHPQVSAVHFPGLPNDPGHAPAARFMHGFGAMISFEVAGGASAADRVCRSVRLIQWATSLGGVESTMERRGAVPGQEHLPAGLLRLSVGCEDAADLWRDLSTALDA